MKKLNVLAGIGCAALMSYGVTAYAKPATASLPVVPLNWTAGTATVDGNTSDWNLATDASTIMCEAGKIKADGTCDGKDHLSTLYTRYDCNTNTMYVLVLKEAGHTADNGESWVKIYDLGNSSVNFSAFSAVSSGGAVQGYEASFALAAGTYNDVQVHITIDGGKTSSTGKIVATRSIVVPENCTVPVVEEPKDCTDEGYAAANPAECTVAPPPPPVVLDCSDEGYAAANPAECTVTPPPVLDCSDEGYAAANSAECTVAPPPPPVVLDCSDEGYAAANPEECTVTPPPVLDCDDAGYAAENPEECTVTYGDSKASVVGIWKYVGSMSAQDFDATYKEGTDYVFTGDDSGDYLLQGIDDEGKTTSMSGAKMK